MEILDQSENTHNGRTVESVLANGYSFNLGDYIGRAFKLFGNDAGSYLGYVLLYFIINFVINMLPFIGGIASLAINPALIAGWYIYARNHNMGHTRGFGNFFDGFKGPHWIQLILASLVTSIFVAIAVAIVIVPFFFSTLVDMFSNFSEMREMRDPDDMRAFAMGMFTGKIVLGIVIAGLLGSLVAVLYCLAPMFIVFRGMSFWDAMEASRKVVTKNYMQFLVFFIVLIVILVIGTLLCCIGLLVAIPIYYLSLYVAFEAIMGTGNVEAGNVEGRIN